MEYFTAQTETREHYGVAADEFAAILIGRDGGEKLRASEPISAQELFGKIDEMPMRRRELRERELRERE